MRLTHDEPRDVLARAEPPEPGSLIFAQSSDRKYYVAEVLSVMDDAVRVRFMRGAQHTVTLEQVRPASFLPGDRVVCNWPWWARGRAPSSRTTRRSRK